MIRFSILGRGMNGQSGNEVGIHISNMGKPTGSAAKARAIEAAVHICEVLNDMKEHDRIKVVKSLNTLQEIHDGINQILHVKTDDQVESMLIDKKNKGGV